MRHAGGMTRLEGWPGVNDTRLKVGKRSVRVLRAGKPGGEPQILVHGLAGFSSTWVEVIERLAAHGPVVAPDLPGFGRTPLLPGERISVGGYAKFVLQLADSLGWDRFTLHGNSMGGLIATMLAARHPERVRRLVLVSPALPPRSPVGFLMPSRTTVDAMVPIAMTSLGAAALGVAGRDAEDLGTRRDRRLLQLIYPDPDAVNPMVLDLLAADMSDEVMTPSQRRQHVLAATRSIAKLWTNPRHAWRAVDQIISPTLLLGGTRDALIPARVLRSVLARRRDWEGHVLEDRRHALMLEDPETYLDLVATWQARSADAA